MNTLFTGLDHDTAREVETLSRLLYDLRENRKLLLQATGFANGDALLDAIRNADLAEHPAYEHHLSVRILEDSIGIVRAQLERYSGARDSGPEGEAPLPPHLALKLCAETGLATHLAIAPLLALDALILHLVNEVELTIRYAAKDAYSLRWQAYGREYGIDTAPLHSHPGAVPNHFHDAAGNVLPDPVTRVDTSPEDNLAALVEALLRDPTLGSGAGSS